MKGIHQIKAFNLWKETKLFNKLKENWRKLKGIDWSCHIFFLNCHSTVPRSICSLKNLSVILCAFICYIVFRVISKTFLKIQGCTPDCLIPEFLETKPCFQNQNFGCRLIWGEASFTIQEIYSIEGKKTRLQSIM